MIFYIYGISYFFHCFYQLLFPFFKRNNRDDTNVIMPDWDWPVDINMIVKLMTSKHILHMYLNAIWIIMGLFTNEKPFFIIMALLSPVTYIIELFLGMDDEIIPSWVDYSIRIILIVMIYYKHFIL